MKEFEHVVGQLASACTMEVDNMLSIERAEVALSIVRLVT
jgi:hypothetical protein